MTERQVYFPVKTQLCSHGSRFLGKPPMRLDAFVQDFVDPAYRVLTLVVTNETTAESQEIKLGIDERKSFLGAMKDLLETPFERPDGEAA